MRQDLVLWRTPCRLQSSRTTFISLTGTGVPRSLRCVSQAMRRIVVGNHEQNGQIRFKLRWCDVVETTPLRDVDRAAQYSFYDLNQFKEQDLLQCT